MTSEKNCIITGASGYLGSKISMQLKNVGWQVWEASSTLHHSNSLAFSLKGGIPPDTLKDLKKHLEEKKIRLLIHCAYDFSARTPTEVYQSNTLGSIRLLKTAREAGVPQIIFISSMAAFEGCRSLYGQAKLQVEKEALPLGVTVLRPGLILGKNTGSIVGAMLKVIARFRWVPLIGLGKQKMFLTYDDDLTQFIEKLSQDPSKKYEEPLSTVHPVPIRFKDILYSLAQARGYRGVILIPVPSRIIWILIRTLEILGAKLKFRSDSVVSFIHGNPSPKIDPRMSENFRDFEKILKSI